MIIVIDGPAGSGKSSTAKKIAELLDIQYLDSGALYRALTYLWLMNDKPDLPEFFKILPGVKLDAEYRNQTFIINVNGEDITKDIRTQQVANHVSEMAAQPEARKFVNQYMRKLVMSDAYIADGRDLGTAVFPDADLKFYMIASLEERAKRRYRELISDDPSISFEEVKDNLKNRDHQDSSRAADPLKKDENAILIDTTGKTFEEQIDEMVGIIRDKIKLKQ
ncbi:(d)CMP kinase [Rhodohalobacter sulfatireducens]|uniref:Cytidylate kinase n=1 Tax=Rhodohalobacter sulfatireducens TaxID=2911366 RepID=A0ABS9KBU0_9BACT|nr:(d)CMP kinase [Rhodohalobacter sulfatireducens]MCG2588325.1 (d)CMP kinase [Rhodohalobacter sulfatireducens]MDR9364535.1 (d)CMP kinase [Balneolaceae bacterium]MDR9409757.1 (d)CMP kinase [Balneolaceae bacterium]